MGGVGSGRNASGRMEYVWEENLFRYFDGGGDGEGEGGIVYLVLMLASLRKTDLSAKI